MPAYATTTDLATLGIAAAALANVPPATQQAAVDAACALADGYLGAKFELPLTSWGKDLTLNVAKIAAFEALRMRGFAPEGIDQAIRDGYTDAIAWLRDIARGVVTPIVVDSSSAGTVGGAFVVAPQTQWDGTVVVTRPTPRGW